MMATYTVQSGAITSAANLKLAGQILETVAEHASGLGFTLSSVALGSGATANMLRVTVSITLTSAQLAHLGLA
jgi:hypothetical protein